MSTSIGIFKSGSTWTFTVEIAESVLVGAAIHQTVRSLNNVVLLNGTGIVLTGTRAKVTFSPSLTSSVCPQKCKTDLKFILSNGEVRHTETFEFTVDRPETP